MKKVKVGSGFALVDDEDYDKVSKISWSNHLGYACWRHWKTRGKRLWMHRLIMNAPEDMIIDHINGNRSDNRKENLRLCTYSENSRNRSAARIVKRDDSGHYRVRVMVHGKTVFDKTFREYDDAKKARDIALLEHHKDFAKL